MIASSVKAKMRVKTPVYLQIEAAECGAVALRIVLAYYGCFVDAAELRDACGVSRDGVRGDHLSKAAKSYGLQARAFRKEIERLREVPAPFISFMSFNHFVVIEGFEEDTVFVNDPSQGRRKIHVQDFEKQFSGVIFTFEKTAEFKQRGIRPSIIPRLRGSYLLLIITALLTLPGLVIPALLRGFVDDFLLRGTNIIAPLLLLTFAVAGLLAVLTWLQQHQALRFENQWIVANASKLMWQLFNLPDSFFTRRSSGEIAGRFQLIDRIGIFFSQDLVRLMFAVLSAVIYLGVLTLYHPVLPLISLILISLYFIAVYLLNRQQREAAYQLQGKLSRLAGNAVHSLQNIEQVKASGAEKDVFNRLVSYYTDIQNAIQELTLSTRALRVLIQIINGLNMLIVLMWGVIQVRDGVWSIGVFAAVQVLSTALWGGMIGLTGFPARLALLQTEYNRLDDAFDQPVRAAAAPKVANGVELHNVHYGYKLLDRPLIENLTITIPAGKSIAIVGSSGSGKTTLARLIAGVYQPLQGEIHQGKTALVDQEIFLFEGTVLENLTLWDHTLLPESILKAVQDAEILTEIQQLPLQYQSGVQESGRNFSGGQRQRLQIARALATDPDILILDEATNALDPLLEQKIYRNIAARGCTCIIISHRLSAVQHCDDIWLMENGKIIESGSHQELLRYGGQYAQFIHTDTSTIESNSVPAVMPAVPSLTLQEVPAALKTLVSLFDDENVFEAVTAHDPVTACCEIVGRELGFTVTRPIFEEGDRVFAVAAASRVYARQIKLPLDWFKQDYGVFIAEYHGTHVVLIWRKTHYLIVDPAQRRVIPVTGDVSPLTSLTAYQFYPSFPEGRVTLTKLLRSTLRNTQADWQIILITGVLISILQILPAVLINVLFDTVLPQEHFTVLWQILSALIVSIIVMALFSFVQETAVTRLLIRAEYTFQSGLWTRLLSLPPSFFRQFSAGDLVSRVVGSRDSFQNLHITVFSGLFSGLFVLASVMFIGLFYTSMFPVMISITGIYLMVLLWTGWRLLHIHRVAVEQKGRNNGWIVTILQGINHFQVMRAEDRGFRLWAERFVSAQRLVIRARKIEITLNVLNSIYPVLALIVLFITALQQQFTLGTFVAFQMLFVLNIRSLTQFGTAYFSLLRIIPDYERLTPIFTTPPETHTGQSPSRLLNGNIHLQEVSFRYQHKLALQNLTLTIRQGEFVAIVGPSGSGKSTLLRILLGFEKPESGEVFYDDQPLSQLDPSTVRAQIGTVMQHSDLINGTSIFNNIRGVHQVTLDDAWRVLRLAGLADDVVALPMGIHTLLTEGGRSLSVGQRQRLLIARSLIHHPRLLFFDEATSALDDQTQGLLIRNLGTFNLTRIMIAHRLSTVLQADRILVMDAGRIVESGTFAELMSKDGLFADLAKRQFLT